MSLQCEVCSRKFATNASLYIHKQTQHNKPTLLIKNHDHSKKRKIKEGSDNSSNKKSKLDPQNDNRLEVVDEYENDENDTYSDDSQDNDKLEVIDEIENDDQDDKDLEIVDEVEDDTQDYDDQNDEKLKITDRYDRPSKDKKKIDYKVLYENCMKRSNKLKDKIKRITRISYKNRKNDKIKMQKEFNVKVTNLKKVHEKQMNDLEILKDGECKDKIEIYEQKIKDTITEMEIKHKKALDDLESESEEKIKKLTDHINSLQDDESDFNSLTDAIFNCTTMEEIFEIQNLIENHQIDVVIERHLKTLQNIFLSLSFGILPICQPQRNKVTDKQRSLVKKIQTTSGNTAKSLIKSNREDVTNLFSIIHDSLKLARNSYNKYGTGS